MKTHKTELPARLGVLDAAAPAPCRSALTPAHAPVCVCVCVSERESERENVCACVCVRACVCGKKFRKIKSKKKPALQELALLRGGVVRGQQCHEPTHTYTLTHTHARARARALTHTHTHTYIDTNIHTYI